ncbi:MAG: hypothetical protein ACLP50_08120 [Solirubrobacteraceae bacterium]
MDASVALLAHEGLWEQRAVVLREWQLAVRRREQLVLRRDRHRVAMSTELMRAGRGLTASQRAWAQQHATYETRPKDRAGRRTLVTWTYQRERIEATTAKWTPILEADTTAIAQADAALAAATATILDAWGPEAPAATGRTRRQLTALARRHTPAA